MRLAAAVAIMGTVLGLVTLEYAALFLGVVGTVTGSLAYRKVSQIGRSLAVAANQQAAAIEVIDKTLTDEH